jgi:hypothetical protein
VAPAGDRVAFFSAGVIEVRDLAGQRVTSIEAPFGFGQAWSPDGKEVWYTASDTGSHHDRALYALSMNGRRRLVARVPGSMSVYDVAPDGRSALIVTGAGWFGIQAAINGATQERTLDLLGRTDITGLSADGARLLVNEAREVGTGTYLQATDGTPPVQLTGDIARGLSPDGALALVQTRDREPRLRLMPTGAGVAQDLPLNPGLVPPILDYAHWSRDGRRVFILLRTGEDTTTVRVYVHEREGGAPWRPVTPEKTRAFRGFAVSPDGRTVAALDGSGVTTLYGVDGQPPKPLAGETGTPIHWTSDGALLLRAPDMFRARIYRRDLATGRIDPWRTLAPPDPIGVMFVARVLVAADDRSYVYQYSRGLNDLYLAYDLR